ncbi:MAG TPA: hypothetical protein VF533_25565 [Solirubrobacteraceae bacterium]|jgi:ElaB/YqjD/DUF883 family membrane-anchored ribosome-binding protein
MESSTSQPGAYGTPGAGGPTSGNGGGAQGAAQQAQEKVSEVAGQAQEQARTTLRSQVDQRSTQAGEQVVSQASDVRTVAEKLREEGKEGPAKVAEQAADRVEKVGGYLRDSDADRILNDVESYARSNPWTVVAGGLALGFVASRFLKASSSDRYRTGSTGAPNPAPAPAPATRQLPASTTAPPPPPPPLSGPPPVAAPASPTTTNPGTGTF